MIRSSYAIANMVVFRNEVVENNLFPEPKYNYSSQMMFLENITPYFYNYAHGDMGDYKYIYTGSKQNCYKIGEEVHYEVFYLKLLYILI